jgi:regulatory protein
MTRCESSPTISALEKIPRRKEYLVMLSDGSELRVMDEDLSRFSLAPGLGLGPSLIDQLKRAYEYSQAKRSALRLLEVRPRTEGELRRALHGKGFGEAALAGVIQELKGKGAVDDRVFAHLWVREKLKKRTGRRRILAELKAKMVDAATAQEELAAGYEDDEEIENARQVALKRAARLTLLPAETKRRRVYDYLVRRGFDADIAAEATRFALRTSGEKGDQ